MESALEQLKIPPPRTFVLNVPAWIHHPQADPCRCRKCEKCETYQKFCKCSTLEDCQSFAREKCWKYFVYPDGKGKIRPIDPSDSPRTILPVVEFLNKLEEKAIPENSMDISDVIKVVIGFNRIFSLNNEFNKPVSEQLGDAASIVKSYVSYIGFGWVPDWRDTETSNSVDFETVQAEYQNLMEKNPGKAELFRAVNERIAHIPYGKIRDYIKDHNTTKLHVEEFQKSKIPVYLSTIDFDTVDFNGIYASYLTQSGHPTVMTTGYIYPKNGTSFAHDLSLIDRQIRLIVAKSIPLGTYYPEPNLCILIPDGYSTVPESFGHGAGESVHILRQIQASKPPLRQYLTFKFFDGRPLITTIPGRVEDKLQNFTSTDEGEFADNNLKALNQTSQSHFKPRNLARSMIRAGPSELTPLAHANTDFCKRATAIENRLKDIQKQLTQHLSTNSINSGSSTLSEYYCPEQVELIDRILVEVATLKLRPDFIPKLGFSGCSPSDRILLLDEILPHLDGETSLLDSVENAKILIEVYEDFEQSNDDSSLSELIHLYFEEKYIYRIRYRQERYEVASEIIKLGSHPDEVSAILEELGWDSYSNISSDFFPHLEGEGDEARFFTITRLHPPSPTHDSFGDTIYSNSARSEAFENSDDNESTTGSFLSSESSI